MLLLRHQRLLLVDEDDWVGSDEHQEEDIESNAVVAESALDRLACGLGGKTVFPQIMALTPVMLQQADWKSRHAALMAISASSEGCHKQMEPLLDQVMDCVMNFIADSHPRVRFACCNAIGQMSTDYSVQEEVPRQGDPWTVDADAGLRQPQGLGPLWSNSGQLLRRLPKNILLPYLPDFMNRLEEVLTAKFHELVQKGNKLVLEQIVTTIASVADTAEEKFVEYYEEAGLA